MGMARSLQVEYGSACYHVMARGNRREEILGCGGPALFPEGCFEGVRSNGLDGPQN
jgi:hypothetical protein